MRVEMGGGGRQGGRKGGREIGDYSVEAVPEVNPSVQVGLLSN